VNTVIVDGDEARRLFQFEKGESFYTLEGRRMVAGRIHDLGLGFAGQRYENLNKKTIRSILAL
jgi:hypothetical protein|tara:strand:+ start:196 stop:384 length:189 start_codon:yes stop_codon:yes gene_type:complete